VAVRHDEYQADSSRPLWEGLDYGPALVVLDVADSAPAELPLSWRRLAQRFQIAWCTVTGGDSALERIEDVLETLDDGKTRTHVIARASVGDAAARVVAEFPQTVRTVVMVGAGRMPESTGVRTVRVGGSDLNDPDVVRELESAVDASRLTFAPIRERC
jgi:hypothetical protein